MEITRLVSPVLVSRWLNKLENRDVAELEHLKHLLGLGIDLNDVVLESGNLRYVVVSAFSLFFLKLDGDSTNLAVTEPLHQMRNKPSDFVLEGFARNDSDFLAYPLVGVEVQGQSSVIFLDDDPSGLLDRLSPNTTHVC